MKTESDIASTEYRVVIPLELTVEAVSEPKINPCGNFASFII
jgi:hypothetical protein